MQWIDTTLGKVRIEKQLAKGGMAEVYLGTHLTLDRPVAIKVLHNFVEADEAMKLRFQREARVVAALRHPNIVQIYDFDTVDGHPYIVMEYIKGPSLALYLRKLHEHNQQMQPEHIGRLLSKLAHALDYAHEQGVIHRDIKPGNILLHMQTGASRAMFTDQIEPIISDFGLVRIVNATTQTASGLVSGTPAYISPEQAKGIKTDHRTDIYSLGVVLYEIVAGRVPFEAETTWSLIYKHIYEAPPPIPNIRPAVQNVIDRALAKDPNDRYQACRDLAADYMDAIATDADFPTLQIPAHSPAVELAPQTPVPVTPSEELTPASTPARRSIVLLLGAVLIVLALVVYSGSRLWSPQPVTEAPALTQHSMENLQTPQQPTGSIVIPPVDNAPPLGVLRFQDGTAPADQVTLTTSSMPLPPAGSQYEAWLIEDDSEQRISLGFITFDQDRGGSLTFVDPQGRNLLGMYRGVEITVEPSPDGNPIPSNDIAFAVSLPSGGLTHVRHLLYAFSATPNETGFVNGLNADTNLIDQIAQEMLAAYESGDDAKVRSQVEAVLNIIVGKQSANYQDWNQDGTINDPSDGFGLLLNGDNEGYIQGTYTHADLSVNSPDATQNMRIHGEHVKATALNISGWTPTLRDQLILFLQSPDNVNREGMIRNAVALANQIQNGFDVNGNENIEPIRGEGGATTAYEHAYYMADILITPAP